MSVSIIAAALAGGSAVADTLLIEGVDKAADSGPQRGLDKATVNETYGGPEKQNEAVGEPQISSWEYPEYVVYFENDLVLHTVAKR
jgi:hypothetical protein